MVNAPHKLKKNNKSYIEEYISAGCQKIALHERSFEDETELISAINIIKKYNAIILATDHDLIDYDLQKKNSQMNYECSGRFAKQKSQNIIQI